MSVASEYIKKVKTPIIKCTITRFLGDVPPSVDGIGTDYDVEVISCSITAGFDQGTATCSLVIKNPYDTLGNAVLFEPMDRVRIKQGWNTTSTLLTTFFGFVDTEELVSPGSEQRLECRDMLKLPQDNYLIHSNRRVYYKDLVPTELDEEGDPMGGQSATNRTVQAIIGELLSDSGISSSRQQLDFIDWPEEGAIVIGNNAVAIFEYESALDAISRICDLIGYRIWADQCGCVQCREVAQIASETPSVTYQSQTEQYLENGSWTTTVNGNLLNVEAKKDDDLRNWVTVIGYGDLASTVAGESDYVPDPPKYRRVEVRSYLLDTPELLIAVANRIYTDLNRLRYTSSVTIEGDPRITLGMVIAIYDKFATSETMNYILYDYSSEFTAGSWVMTLNLTGGVGTGSEPVGNISPVALFEYSVESEYMDGDAIHTDVFVDASSSYDPDGDLEDLSYVWTVSGFDNGTGITNVYHLTEQSSLVVTLTVTDSGDPQLSNSMTQTISCLVGEGATWKTLFVAGPDSTVYYSADGGKTWNSRQVF
jgi:hypothetical protein